MVFAEAGMLQLEKFKSHNRQAGRLNPTAENVSLHPFGRQAKHRLLNLNGRN